MGGRCHTSKRRISSDVSNLNLGEGGKRKVSNFVLDSLPPKMRDKGVKSKKYKQVHAQKIHMSRSYFYIYILQEEPLFLALALKTFNKSFNSCLMDATLLTIVKSELAEKRADDALQL